MFFFTPEMERSFIFPSAAVASAILDGRSSDLCVAKVSVWFCEEAANGGPFVYMRRVFAGEGLSDSIYVGTVRFRNKVAFGLLVG